MDKTDCYRTLTHSRCYTPDHAVPHVTGGEDTRHAGLLNKWIAFQLPVPGSAPVANQVLAGIDESGLIPLNETPYEISTRNSADKYKHGISRQRCAFSALVVLDCDRLKMVAAINCGYLGVHFHRDVFRSFDLIYQVLGHTFQQ